jgi:CDP-glycerol glycerophosphotransferase
MLGAPERDSQTVTIVARQSSWPRSRTRLPTEAVCRPELTQSAAQQFAGLDWAGFVATLDPAELGRRRKAPVGKWEIGAEVRADGVVRTSWRPTPARLHPDPALEAALADGSWLRVYLAPGGNMILEIRRRPPPRVRSYVVDQGVLQLEGDMGSAAGAADALGVSRRGSETRLEYPVYVDRASPQPTFLARVPLAELFAVEPKEAEGEMQARPEVEWDVDLRRDGRLAPLRAEETLPASEWRVDDRSIGVRAEPNGPLVLVERGSTPVLTEVAWTAPGILRLAGRFDGAEGGYELLLKARVRAEKHVFPLEHDAEAGSFRGELALGEAPTVGGTRPLGEGLWHVLLRPRGNEASRGIATVYDERLLESLPVTTKLDGKRFHLGILDDQPVIAAERGLAADERGGLAQRRLRTAFYGSQRSQPLLDAIVYESFGGREYSESPRAIHEELVRRNTSLEHLWVVRDGAFRVPETATAIHEGSRQYYEALARVRYVVGNDYWPRWLARRPDQVFVQTWHGAPLKHSGYDLARRSRAVRQHRRVLDQRGENWQHVVSAGPFATPIMRRAFPAENVLETGLPRTDFVAGPSSSGLAAEVRQRLGLGERRVLLYAPTYRDALDYRIGYRTPQPRDAATYAAEAGFRDGYRLGPLLSLEALAAALGAEDLLLVRKHPRVTDALPNPGDPRIVDVSSYGDALGLLLAADVLVTDYSSLVFDFASTGRPIVLYTPDLNEFRDSRGLTIDWEAVAPTPLLCRAEEALEAVREVDPFLAEHRDRYEEFVSSHCSLQDGRASARLVEAVFRW